MIQSTFHLIALIMPDHSNAQFVEFFDGMCFEPLTHSSKRLDTGKRKYFGGRAELQRKADEFLQCKMICAFEPCRQTFLIGHRGFVKDITCRGVYGIGAERENIQYFVARMQRAGDWTATSVAVAVVNLRVDRDRVERDVIEQIERDVAANGVRIMAGVFGDTTLAEQLMQRFDIMCCERPFFQPWSVPSCRQLMFFPSFVMVFGQVM